VTSIPSQAGLITATQNPICSGSKDTFRIAAVTGATSYIWSLPNGWTGTSTTTQLASTSSASSGNVIVIAHNSCGNSPGDTLAIVVNTAVPAVPAAIFGATFNPCQGSVETYTIASVNTATSYIWTIPSGWTGTSTGTSITVTVGLNPGNMTVKAVNACGASAAFTQAMTVNHVLTIAGSISGPTSPCVNSSQTYSIAAVTGATGYTWSYSGSWTGSSTTNSITASIGSSGTVSVTANNVCGASSPVTLTVTVANVPAQPGVIKGNMNPCQGTTTRDSIALVATATSYTWSMPSGWTGTSTTTLIISTVGTTGGTIQVIANNACGSSSPRDTVAGVNTILGQPGSITGNNPVCANSHDTYTITAMTGATSYTWTVGGTGWSGSSTMTSIATTAGTATGTLTVKANNVCGAGVAASSLTVTVTAIPGTPGAITGPNPVCTGATGLTYTVPTLAGALNYYWAFPAGWSPQFDTTTVPTVTVNAGTVGGNMTVKGNNACGTSAVASTLTLTVNAGPPATPGTISGAAAPCPGSITTYTIAAVPTATSYFWQLPSGWTGTSTTTSITCTVGTAGGNIVVLAINACGYSSSASTKTVTLGAGPGTPGTITHATGNGCSGSANTFTITAVSGSPTPSYVWTLPSAWTGTSTTTSIATTPSTTSGYVKVYATNTCGNSPADSLLVTIGTVPAQPSVISGPTVVCQGSTVTYTVVPVNGLVYAWKVPASWTGTSTTASITVTVGNTITGGDSVRASNTCGTGPYRILTLTGDSLLSITMTNSGAFCDSVSPRYVQLMATPAHYNSYVWSPNVSTTATATVSSVNTYNLSATNSSCTAKAVAVVTTNPCGVPTALSVTVSGTTVTFHWTGGQCAIGDSIQVFTNSGYTGNPLYKFAVTTNATSYVATIPSGTYYWRIKTQCYTTQYSAYVNGPSSFARQYGTSDGADVVPFNVFPNPANSQVTVSFATMMEGNYRIRLVDMFGRIAKMDLDNTSGGDAIHVMNLQGIAKGVYIIELEISGEVYKTKLVIQ
jgi:large repetitive protein